MIINAVASLPIPAAPEQVYDHLTTPHTFPPVFKGYGPVPGMQYEELPAGHSALGIGLVRHVYGVDGSVLAERIETLERPTLYGYTILGGLTPPLAWLVRHADVTWRIHAEGEQSRIVWRYAWHTRGLLTAAPVLLITRLFLQPAMRQCLQRIRARIAAQGQAAEVRHAY